MSDTQTWQNFLSVDDVKGMGDVKSKASIAMQTQFSGVPKLSKLAQVFHGEMDASDQLDQIHSVIADVQTAGGVFLDWWGERVGVSRYLKVKDEYVRFDDDYYRFLIMYRAVCNVSDSTAATMNKMLSTLTSTRVFVVDYQTMSIQSIVVIGDIEELQAQILETYGLLNRPAGVLTNFLIIYPDEQIFGFDGQGLHPFDQGVFNPGRTIGDF
jgi:hypothetical protein